MRSRSSSLRVGAIAVLGVLVVVALSALAVAGVRERAEAAQGQPLGRLISLSTSEAAPGLYRTALVDVQDCGPVSLMVSLDSDNENARAQFAEFFVSPDGAEAYVGGGSAPLPFFPPFPPGVPGPNLTKVAGTAFTLGTPYFGTQISVLEVDEGGGIIGPISGATVDVDIWCVFGSGGTTVNVPFPPGGPPNGAP